MTTLATARGEHRLDHALSTHLPGQMMPRVRPPVFEKLQKVFVAKLRRHGVQPRHNEVERRRHLHPLQKEIWCLDLGLQQLEKSEHFLHRATQFTQILKEFVQTILSMAA